MNYFVTGATGFIGRHLVEQLLERDGTIYVLVREGSRGQGRRAGPEPGRPGGADRPGLRRPVQGQAGRGGLLREDRPPLPPRGRLRHGGRRGGLREGERPGHAQRRRLRQRARRRALPPRQLDRRRRLLQGRVPGGHVRRGPEAAPPLPPDQVRVRGDGPQRRGGEDPRLPARHGRGPLRDRRDGQDRRPVLHVQAAQEAARRAARVVPAGRARGRQDHDRAGRLRGQGDGPHRPPARRRPARATPTTWSTPSR